MKYLRLVRAIGECIFNVENISIMNVSETDYDDDNLYEVLIINGFNDTLHVQFKLEEQAYAFYRKMLSLLEHTNSPFMVEFAQKDWGYE